MRQVEIKFATTLAARLDAGPTALHRLPEPVAHVAEALWMHALDEGRLRDKERTQARLESQIQELTMQLGKERAARETYERRIVELTGQFEDQNQRIAKRLAAALMRNRLEVPGKGSQATPSGTKVLARRRGSAKPLTTRTPLMRKAKGMPNRAASLRTLKASPKSKRRR